MKDFQKPGQVTITKFKNGSVVEIATVNYRKAKQKRQAKLPSVVTVKPQHKG